MVCGFDASVTIVATIRKKRTFATIATHSASKPHIIFYSDGLSLDMIMCISIASCTVCLVFLLTLEQVWLKPIVTGMQTLVVMVHLRHVEKVPIAVTRVSYPLLL